MECVNIGFRTGEGKLRTGRRIDEAIDFLRRELADGSRYANDIDTAATTAGITERTLRRARKRLRIRPWKSPNGRWVWPPPKSGDEGGHEGARSKNVDTLATLDKTKHLLTRLSVSPGIGGQDSRSGHDAGQLEQSTTNPRFTLDQILDFIQDASVRRQARQKIRMALEEAIPHAAVFKKVPPEKAPTWLMGRCCQYYETVRATWPQDQWRYAKKPADFLSDKTWREEPVIWDRSQQLTKEKANGRNTSVRDSHLEELRRAVTAARATACEPNGMLASVGPW